MSYVLTTMLRDKIKTLDLEIIFLRDQSRKLQTELGGAPSRNREIELHEEFGTNTGYIAALVEYKDYLSDLASAIELDERI